MRVVKAAGWRHVRESSFKKGLGVETIGICTVVIFLYVWASRFTQKGRVEN